jgi:hypothetical protein
MPSYPRVFIAARSDPPPASRTSPPGRHRKTTATRRGYQCEAVAYTPQEGRAFPLGTHPAATPRLALRWLRRRARDIANQLDAPAARPVRHWISDRAEHERALTILARGETYTFTIFDDATRYALSAHPTGNPR